MRSRNSSRQRAVAGGAVAIASVLKIPGDEAAVAAVRAKEKDFAGEVGVSAWNGLALARLVAPDGAALHRDLIAVLTAFGNMPLPRIVAELAHPKGGDRFREKDCLPIERKADL